jgi:hypothetical protein
MIKGPNEVLAMFEKQDYVRIYFEDNLKFAYIEGKDDLVKFREVNWENLAKHYGTGSNGIYIGFDENGNLKADNSPTWQEVSFGSKDPEIEKYGSNINQIIVQGTSIDSYTIQAMRKGLFEPGTVGVIENAVQGIVVMDKEFPLGVRYGSNTLQVIPGGCVRRKKEYNKSPIEDAFHSETSEELGAIIEQDSVRLIGIFNQKKNHPNRQWTFVGESNDNIGSLVEKQRLAVEIYNELKIRFGDEGLARNYLKESIYVDDAWENTSLHAFSYDPETFVRLLSERNFQVPGRDKIEFNATLFSALYLVGSFEFGKDFRKEVEKLPHFTEEISFENKL